MSLREHGDGRGFTPPRDAPSVLILEGLPTNKEILSRGADQISRIKSRLGKMEREGEVSAGTIDNFVKDIPLGACLLGLLPEVGTFHPTRTMAFPLLINVVLEEAPNLVVVQHPPVSWNDRPRGVVNLDAAEVVVSRRPEFFPLRAKNDLSGWLTESSDEWFPTMVDKEGKLDFSDPARDILHTRMGILSGFPVDAALKYSTFQRARGKFASTLYPDERKLWADYLAGYIKRDEYFVEDLRRVLEAHGEKLTDDEKTLILKTQRVEFLKGATSFFGFSEADIEYGKKIDQVFKEIETRALIAGVLESFAPMFSKLPPWVLEELKNSEEAQ